MVATKLSQCRNRTKLRNDNIVEFEPGQKELYEINNIIIRMYLPMVEAIVEKIKTACPVNIHHDDLLSIGVYGLIIAIEKYQPNEDIDFEEFCKPKIKTVLLDAIRYASWKINLTQTQDTGISPPKQWLRE